MKYARPCLVVRYPLTEWHYLYIIIHYQQSDLTSPSYLKSKYPSIIPSTMDALDHVDYDPVVHLQMLFSTPSSVAKLPEVAATVALHRDNLSREITAASRAAENVKNQEYYTRILDGHSNLEQLYSRIDELRGQAHETETKITTMTSHIISLDKTKSNLIHSITVLKRLQMLTTACDQLKTLVKNRHYREMSQTLPAVQELMSHFKPFRSIDQIATLNRQVGEMQSQITDQIFSDFETVLSGKGDLNMANNLSDATLVLEQLGEENKKKLVHWYCSTQLREYRTIFKSSDEAGSLENIGRRYAYFKRLLKQHVDSNAKYFNQSWHMAEELTNAFCNNTRDDIRTLLAHGARNIEIQLLLKALQETLEFEQYLEKRFGSVSDSRTDSANVDKIKHPEAAFTSGKTISLAFQPHLNIWIDHQDKQLAIKFQQFRAPPAPKNNENGETEQEADPTVLPSSADLFIFYRQILAQTAKLSTSEPLLNLSKLFAKWLDTYCNQILRPTFPNRLNDEDDFKTLALVISTADYCTNTTSQLEDRVQSTIDEDLRQQVSFDSQRSKFLDIVNLGIKRLVGKVELSLEYSWREMANTNWSKLHSVGDQSSYVSELNRSLTNETKKVLQYITKKTYVRLICDKIVEAVSSAFLLGVVKCRPISEVASEQMLLDLYVVKNTLLKLPSTAEEGGTDEPPSAAYSRHVTSSVGRVETILKVILTQNSPPEGLVQNYFYLIGDKSADNFKKIMDLKGMSRSEQSRFLELFNAHMKAHDKLVDESPLLKALRLTGGGSLVGYSDAPNSYKLNGNSSTIGTPYNGLLNSSGSSGILTSSTSRDTFSLGHSNGVSDSVSALTASVKASPPTLHIPRFETPKGFTMAKDQIEKSFEKITQDTPVSKFNENMNRTFGRLFRRDANNN